MRTASQLTFCSPNDIRPRAVVEQNEEGIITNLINLDDHSVESAHTLFFDGIISAEIISVKQQGCFSPELISGYQYLDVSAELPTAIEHKGKPLLLDFGTDYLGDINRKLPAVITILPAFSAYEIIAACTYYPALALGLTASLSILRKTRLMLWEGSDLANKKLTLHSRVRQLI